MLQPQKHTAIRPEDEKEFLEMKNVIKEINSEGLKNACKNE